MSTFVFDAYKDDTPEQLKAHCRRLGRLASRFEQMVLILVDGGTMPAEWVAEIDRLREGYRDNDEPPLRPLAEILAERAARPAGDVEVGERDGFAAFERATDLVSRRLAFFRDDCAEPDENEKLMAGHIVGNLWANDLLNTAGEKWEPVNRRDQSSGRTDDR